MFLFLEETFGSKNLGRSLGLGLDRDCACLKEVLRGMREFLKCFLLSRWHGQQRPPALLPNDVRDQKLRNVFFPSLRDRYRVSTRSPLDRAARHSISARNREHFFCIKLRRVFVLLPRYGLSQAEDRERAEQIDTDCSSHSGDYSSIFSWV